MESDKFMWSDVQINTYPFNAEDVGTRSRKSEQVATRNFFESILWGLLKAQGFESLL